MKYYEQLLVELKNKYPTLESAMEDPQGFLSAGREVMTALVGTKPDDLGDISETETVHSTKKEQE